MNPRVKKVNIQENYHLLLLFENGEKKIFDTTPYLEKGIFKELKQKDVFNSVRVIDGTIQWQNEADFCPDTLYLESLAIS